MRTCKTKLQGKWKQKAWARMPGAVRSHLQILGTEPGGSCPVLTRVATKCTLKPWQHKWEPAPGGCWPQVQGALDYLLAPLKIPGLFPARHLFGSRGVLLAPLGGGTLLASSGPPAIHGWIARFWEPALGLEYHIRSPFSAFQTTSHCPVTWQWLDLSQRWSAWRRMRIGSTRCPLSISWCPSRMMRHPNKDAFRRGCCCSNMLVCRTRIATRRGDLEVIPRGTKLRFRSSARRRYWSGATRHIRLLRSLVEVLFRLRKPVLQAAYTAIGATTRLSCTGVACRTNFVCWDHGMFPACLEGLEILVCGHHGRLTPGVGSWNPPGGVEHRGALRATRGRGVANGWEHTALAEQSLRPDLESRRRSAIARAATDR
eukprot:3288753-Amphidinium_carterae.1